MKQPSSRFTFHASRLTLIAILLCAFFLRLYRLDAQSFWNDEGNSARIAERSLDLVVEGAAGDIHPPGYYLLLHYWRALCGQSEFALRFLSVAAGLATVVFTYLLGRHLFGAATGLMAAFLGAISPFAIYYSQEARMYALLVALSAASTYLLVRLLQKSGFSEKTRFLAYVLTCAAGLYTHYAFPFVLLVHNLIFGLWWLATARRWRWVAVWAGAQVLIVALYLPWLPIALRSVTGWSPAGQGYDLSQALLDVLHILIVGNTLPLKDATAALVGAGLLLLAGLWPRKGRWFGVASLAFYLLLPILLIFAFDLYKPAWLKFLIVVLPPFHLLLAHGIENPTQFPTRNSQFAIRTLLLASCCLLLAPSLHNLYFNPAYGRDDYRQIAADIAAAARPGDAVILDAPNQWEVFTYYYPAQDIYPAPYHPDPGATDEFLAPLVGQYRRLFVLYWGDAESDPQRLVETWLAGHAYKSSDRWYGRVRLATYGVAALPEEPAVALDARFGDDIQLRGYALIGDRFAPGDILPVTLFWEAQATVAERYKVTVQLLDGGGRLLAQIDTEPGDGLSPTDTWQPGQTLADRYGLALPDDLPPGRYAIVAAMYRVSGGERLPVVVGGALVGNHLTLKSVEIE